MIVFQVIGSLVLILGARLAGVRFVPVRFTPRASTHKDVECGGVNIVITDRSQFEPIAVGE